MSNQIPSLPGEAVAPRYLSVNKRLYKSLVNRKSQPRFTVILALPGWVDGTVDQKSLIETVIADSPELAVQLLREDVVARIPSLKANELDVLAVFEGEHRSLV